MTRSTVSPALWIIGIFALGALLVVFLAAPNFEDMLTKSTIGATKGNLNSIQSSINLYNADHHGKWPAQLEDLSKGTPKYLNSIPVEGVTESNRVVSVLDGKGGWVYNSKTGRVSVNLKGYDPFGNLYRNY